MKLIERCKKFLDELDVPVAALCRKVQISTQTYYSWRAGRLQPSTATLQRIDKYLKKYNF